MGKSLEIEILTVEELEEEKKKAIADWNGLRYMQVCDALGMEADVPDLYGRGVIDFYLNHNGEGTEVRKGTKNESNYAKFLRETQENGIDLKSFLSDTDMKRRLLGKYFPRKFGDRAKKPIIDYAPASIGYVFNKLVDHAQEVIRQ